MNAPGSRAADAQRLDSWWARLRDAPHAHDLFQALRWLDALAPGAAPLGRAARPIGEPVRLGVEPSLGFAPAMLAGVRDSGARPHLAIRGFGLFGPNGPLPLHLTEYARERAQQYDDPTFAAFADVFHHRLILLFYRAWADAQPAASLDRPGRARFDAYLASLIGRAAPDAVAKRMHEDIAPHAQYFHAGHLVRHTRNPEGLAQILRRHFGVPVRIVEHVAQWLPLDRAQRCVVGEAHLAPPLGSAALGVAVRDAQSRIKIVLGPLTLAEYRRFLPGGTAARALEQWVRDYVGIEFDWKVQLELAPDEVPALALGSRETLGLGAWIGRRLDPAPARELVLDYSVRRRPLQSQPRSA
ncbi:type VI secretion system baseplate subunit TssG [Paraburkholderia sp. NMBU_R16]|uniref:type VI secretion system baseplate subunit TssG n=1 Tax=Paraburkholderia sp. NMBU_R16 TaxID=2698676 RepID=UPI0020B8DB64|nr:type VI secretion system baseplate subunit TssG [Paraburkholderia sp. NMBU_R16]